MQTPRLRSPETVAFADLWYDTRARVGLPIPAKEDMPLRQLARFMPHMTLVGFEEDHRGKYLLCGTALASQVGIDLTGHLVEDTLDEPARVQRAAGIAEFEASFGPDAFRARWTICDGRTSTGRIVEFEDLSLPYLVPETGAMRHMCFVTLVGGALDYDEGVAQRFPAKEALWFDGAVERPAWLAQDPHSAALTKPDVA